MSAAPTVVARRLTEGLGHGTTSLALHRSTYPMPTPPGRRPAPEVAEVVSRSGLRGKGGAGFPTGRKLATVAASGRASAVVVNGAEGEPASAKDRVLLQSCPHLVLDGAAWAARAVGARRVIVAVDRRHEATLATVRQAVLERMRAEPTGPAFEVAGVPARFVAGEETALIRFLEGGPAKPSPTRQRPYVRGVANRPTVVDNVETLAHVAQILTWGDAWFREVGTADEPGTTLLTVTGAVERPGVYEAPLGAPLAEVMRWARPTSVQAVLVGGYFGTWISAEAASQAVLSAVGLGAHGARIGCGAVVVLPDGACGISESARILGWMAGESAGQCGVCVNGLGAIRGATRDLATGAAGWPERSRNGRGSGEHPVERLHRWADQLEGRGACAMPDAAARFLRSALDVFAVDIGSHLVLGPCDGCRRSPLLPLPPGPKDAWT